VIRRFLLLREGEPCNELRRAESERILRAQPFIADASVQAVANADGSVDLVVRTADEIAVVLSGSAMAGFPPVQAIRLGNANINGMGMYGAANWREGDAYRDAVGARFIDNQLFGRPYRLVLDGQRSTLGGEWIVEATHPFFTDIQRVAWRARWGGRTDYVGFPTDTTTSHSLPVPRSYFDVGGIVRIGPPGRLSLFGAAITGNDDNPSRNPVLITDSGLVADPGSELRNRYIPHRMMRANILWGVRDIGFIRVRGFDALNANQDLPVGFQLGAMFGRSLAVLGSRDDDIFVTEDLYIGAGTERSAIRVQVQGEGRLDNTINRWNGILTSAHALQYLKLSPGNTATASVEWAGGWRQLIPFRLTLGGRDGVRGYGGSDAVGARRLIWRLEDRVYLGKPWGFGDFGVGAFADAGRLWSGDAPYGVDTGLRSSFGLSLLGAVPSGSARMWRLDFAFAQDPLAGGPRFQVSFQGLDKTPFFLQEPPDVEVARERTVPSSVFRWP
jgi:hypothetical protein